MTYFSSNLHLKNSILKTQANTEILELNMSFKTRNDHNFSTQFLLKNLIFD